MRDVSQAVAARIAKAPSAQVWTPVDFLDLGSHAAVDKVLQRLVQKDNFDTSIAVSMTRRVWAF